MTSYNTFVKHAEKMLKKVSTSRPALKGAYHGTNGSVIATDSHRLYELFNGFQTSEAFIQNLSTGERIDENYPDTSRLIPEMRDAKYTVQLNVKDALNAAKAMVTAHKAINNPARTVNLQLTTDESVLTLCAGTHEDSFQAKYNIATLVVDDFNLHFQGQYLIDALALFKDAGELEVNLRYYGNPKPFILESKDVTVLLLPLRV